jgi:glutamate synthase (ferredoxin)
MMRVCHLNTCPVGVATQDPELRKRFSGRPEYVVNFFRFLAQEVREYMAQLGFRTMAEMIGRVDRLDIEPAVDHWKARGLDLSPLLHEPDVDASVPRRCVAAQDHALEKSLDHTTLIPLCRAAIEEGKPVELALAIRNVHRTVGTMLGYKITSRWGSAGLPPNTIRIRFSGSAGQSFGAFAPRGITFALEGDANDYWGKGLSGGTLAVYPPRAATFAAEENIIIGNVALYGATSGEAYVRGVAGERFAVRNSGVAAVVEGVGDHGCEYMTGGRVIVLGRTGRNFAAGMSGGIAYLLDVDGDARRRVNRGMVDVEPLADAEDIALVRDLIERHVRATGSTRGQHVLDQWIAMQPRFVKIMPRDYRRVLGAEAQARAEGRAPTFAELVGTVGG